MQLTLPQSGDSLGTPTRRTGQDLKDLMTGIKSTSESIATSKETLKELDESLQQLAVASNIAAVVKDQQEGGNKSGTVEDHNDLLKDIPFQIKISVQTNHCGNRPEDRYTVVLRLTNRSFSSCSGWSISVSLSTVSPLNTELRQNSHRSAVTVPLPKLNHLQDTEVALPTGDLPLLGYPIQVTVILILQLNHRCVTKRLQQKKEPWIVNSASAVTDRYSSVLHIPLPVTILDVCDFLSPSSREMDSRVPLSRPADSMAMISSVGKERSVHLEAEAAHQSGDTELGMMASSMVSTLVVKRGNGRHSNIHR